MPNRLFVGNVLPSQGEGMEGDPTFDFSTEESKKMNMDGIPIRIEHEPGLAVGKVKRSWTDNDGKKWIVGELENNSMESIYANHAIVPDSRGHTLYKGLSLQHVHRQYSNGSSSKHPIEVSICTEPRRENCYIRAVSETKKNDYIAHKASKYNNSMSDSNVQNTQPTSQEISAPVVETPVTNTSNSTPGTTSESVPVPTNTPSVEGAALARTPEELKNLVMTED